jgi:hypothetical protein
MSDDRNKPDGEPSGEDLARVVPGGALRAGVGRAHPQHDLPALWIVSAESASPRSRPWQRNGLTARSPADSAD